MIKAKGKMKVAVAMSGGVDSGVAAYLLKKAGFDLVGFHLHLWADKGRTNRCCSTELSLTAKKLADQLGLPFYVLDYSRDFRATVVDYFLKEYAAGRTPNPCVVCNEKIKFGRLLEFAKLLGCDYLATGHYARVETLHATSLHEARDKAKDQSYFLWRLSQDQLRHVLFPVGDLKKSEVWEIARVQNLPVYKSKESFEICFVGDDYREFLKKHLPEGSVRSGEIVTMDGEVIGRHEGLPLYTIGQREGLEVRPQKGSGGFVPPLYIVEKDTARNRLVVGSWQECERREFYVGDMNWMRQVQSSKFKGQSLSSKLKVLGKMECTVCVRLRGEKVPCRVEVGKNKTARVILERPLWGVTPGQSAVFYGGEEVLGGGVIV